MLQLKRVAREKDHRGEEKDWRNKCTWIKILAQKGLQLNEMWQKMM